MCPSIAIILLLMAKRVDLVGPIINRSWGVRIYAATPTPRFTPLAFRKGKSLHYKAVYAVGVTPY